MDKSDIKLPVEKKSKKKRVVIGLDDSYDEEQPFRQIDINKLLPNPNQPRRYFDQVALESLAKDIRLRGLLQPLIVKKIRYKEQYMIVAGERRYRAMVLAYASATIIDVPCKVMSEDTSEDEVVAIGLVENLQREALGPLEISEQINHWSKNINKSKTYVSDHLSLIYLPEQTKDDLRVNPKLYAFKALVKEARKNRQPTMPTSPTETKVKKVERKPTKHHNPKFIRKKDSEMYPIAIGKKRYSVMVNVICDAQDESEASRIANMYIGGQRDIKMIGQHTETLTKIKKPKEKK